MCVHIGSASTFLELVNYGLDYIYFDTDERRRFAQVSVMNILLNNYNFNNSSLDTATDMELNFNHPVKELILSGAWVTCDGGSHGNIATDARLATTGLATLATVKA